MTDFSNNHNGFSISSLGLNNPKNLDINLSGISSTLASLGLNCPQNNIQTLQLLHSEIKSTLPNIGETMRIASPKEIAKDYEYSIDYSNEAFSQMAVLLAHIDIIKDNQIYFVATDHVNNEFESSTIGAIKEAFTAAGQIIGKVQNGHIDVDQTTALISNTIQSLSDSSSNDFSQEDKQILFLIPSSKSKNNEGEYVKVIAGVKYHYKFNVKDINNKKSKTHKSSYFVEQSNMIFTDKKIFDAVYSTCITHVKGQR